MREFTLATRQAWSKDSVDDPPAARVTFYDEEETVLHRLTPLLDGVADEEGNEYDNYTIKIAIPDDPDEATPRGGILIGINTPHPILVQMLNDHKMFEISVRMELFKRSTPEDVEWSSLLNIVGATVEYDRVSLSVGYRSLLEERALRLRYTPEVAPGLFRK